MEVSTFATSLSRVIETIAGGGRERGTSEIELSRWRSGIERLLHLFKNDAGQPNEYDVRWLTMRLEHLVTSGGLVARHPWKIAHKHETNKPEVFRALMAWAWEFDHDIGVIDVDEFDEFVRDRQDVEDLLSWIDELGDLLDEPENRDTLKGEEIEARRQGTGSQVVPFLFPFRARHLLDELEYRHCHHREQQTKRSNDTISDAIRVSSRLLDTVYADLGSKLSTARDQGAFRI
ncbi:hypothetical protein JCM3766R1_005272 [Sporobolomyces carnicolor]